MSLFFQENPDLSMRNVKIPITNALELLQFGMDLNRHSNICYERFRPCILSLFSSLQQRLRIAPYEMGGLLNKAYMRVWDSAKEIFAQMFSQNNRNVPNEPINLL